MSTFGKDPNRNWIVTYCDMVTLLMAFFMGLLAFSTLARSKQPGCPERNAVVWRMRVPAPHRHDRRADLEPLLKNPSGDKIERILKALEDAEADRSLNSFAIRLPRDLLFGDEDRLTPSGGHLLHALARRLRDLSYDLHFHVGNAEDVPRAVRLCDHLATVEGYEPARLAVGGRPPRDEDRGGIWMLLVPPS